MFFLCITESSLINNIMDDYICLASKGDTSELISLLADRSVSLQVDGELASLLCFHAASKGHLDMVRFLLEQGNWKDSSITDVNSPIHVAAKFGHVDVIKVLVEHRFDVNKLSYDGPDHNKYAPLHVAAIAGRLPVVEYLIQQGATIDIECSGWLRTPLMEAAGYGSLSVVQHLVQNGAVIDLADVNGVTALHRATQWSHIFVLKFLIENGADKDKVDEDGRTTLTFATNEEIRSYLRALDGLHLAVTDESLLLLKASHCSLWFDMIFLEFPGATDKVSEFVARYPKLAFVKDVQGRVAMDIASKTSREIMQSLLLWHGRYRIIEQRPEHMSATCYVSKAVNESILDESGYPIRVALKLMKDKTHYNRELSTRSKAFNHEYVVSLLQAHSAVESSLTAKNNQTDNNIEYGDVEADATGQLTKTNAEKLYLLVMPLADRNLFVALKQERWAGKNMEEVRHVFVQLVHCVEHMHEKGVLHADLKTLNIVRTTGQWKLIDLDAACVIGKEPVGHKSSSCYVPPEAVYIDNKTDIACVRSVVAVTKGEATYDLLTAHPSFDVWSLGCILYQMCTPDVKPLFQGGQDDNLVGVRKGVDNLFALAEWSSELKADKLADVPDMLARNLLSQMLHKDPLQRPSLARVLAHPLLSGKKVARLVGEKPKYDVFLSYRVASDSQHVEKLHCLLTAEGFKVYWDKLCLEPGVDWEQGFCEGLVSSRAFVPLLSRDAINHPDKDWQNFSKLTADQPNCDNVFLEHRLAVELQGLGLIEKMFPVFIGNLDTTTSEYSHYFGSGCHPALPDIMIKSVEEKLRHHMESQALGTPLEPDRTVKSVVGAITACQGAFIVGPADATFAEAAASIAKMLTDAPVTQSPRGGIKIHQTLMSTNKDIKTLVAENSTLHTAVDFLNDENSALKGKVGSLESMNAVVNDENNALKHKMHDALASLRSGKVGSVEAVIGDMEALLQG